ncbi:MAG: Rieske 2Fe-2S domain-containing protein [Myxococcales bacterium]|nr:Rieske 2Fe-2S domain-containing protein [Myxococcales bacterium]
MQSLGAQDSLHATANGEERLDVRRRRELVEAAISSIAEHGLSGTTVAKVAQAAGLSPGIVNFYFQGKDALLLATLQYVAEEFERRRREAIEHAGDDPVRKIEAILENDFDPAVCNPRWVAVWIAFWGEARARADYMRVCGSRDAAYLHQTVQLFEQIAHDGGYDGVDAKALGVAFTHMLNALPENLLDESRSWDRDRAKQTCRRFLASVFPAEFGSASDVSRAASAQRQHEPALDAAPAPRTLAAWTYHNAEFHELEKERVFRRHWLVAGHASEMPKAGDYVTLDVADERALVIRGRDGALRAFHNVCRHRASRVAGAETGHCSGAIVCPYHGWSYGFDGALRSVPAERSFSGLKKSSAGLREIDIEEWMGFVFVRFAGSGPRVRDLMGRFDAELLPYRLADMKPQGDRWSFDLDVNWKIVVENDCESYHIPLGHPGLRRLFGDSFRDESGGDGTQRAFATLQDKPSAVFSEHFYQKLLPEMAHLPETHRRAWAYYAMFPRTVLSVSPTLAAYYQVVPLGAHKTRMHGFCVGLEDDRRETRAARYLNMRINRRVGREDAHLCRWADAGLRSSGYGGGYLSELEYMVREFQDRIRALLPVADREEAPAAGRVAEVNRELQATAGGVES